MKDISLFQYIFNNKKLISIEVHLKLYQSYFLIADNFEHQQPLVNVKRKRVVKFCDQEILLMLRSYHTYPCAWVQIHKSMIDNIHQLPLETQNLYNSSNAKEIKDRLSTKLSKLLSVSDLDIKNITIR